MNMNNELNEKIDQWIASHRDELVKDTVELIKIRSISDKLSDIKPFGQGCKDALDAYIAMGERYGLKSRNFDNYVAELYNPDNCKKKKRVGLMGHLDVVPEGDNWIFSPYGGIVKGDWIIGRGSQDNKGPCLAAMYVVRCLRDLGVDLEYDVCSLAGTDEETGMADAEYYSKTDGVPDLIIVTDSGFPICYGERGIVSGWMESKKTFSGNIVSFTSGTATNQIPDKAELVLKKTEAVLEKIKNMPKELFSEKEETVSFFGTGIASHIASANNAVNAIGVLMKLLIKYDLLEDVQDKEIVSSMEKIVNSKNGVIFNLSPEEKLANDVCFGCCMAKTENSKLRVSLNIRCPIELDENSVMERVKKLCTAEGFLLAEERILPSNYFPKERPVIQELSEVFNKVTKLNLEPQIFVAGTHARKLPNAVAFGPGIPDKSLYEDKENLFPVGHGSCHMPDEAQSIPALLVALKIYILGVIAIDGKELTKE